MTRFFAALLQRQLCHFVQEVDAQIREGIDSLEVRSTMHEQMSNLKIYNAYSSAGGEILSCSNCEESMKTCVQVYFYATKTKI